MSAADKTSDRTFSKKNFLGKSKKEGHSRGLKVLRDLKADDKVPIVSVPMNT